MFCTHVLCAYMLIIIIITYNALEGGGCTSTNIWQGGSISVTKCDQDTALKHIYTKRGVHTE